MSSYTLILIVILNIFPSTISAQVGSWQLLQNNVGISAMHMQLLHNDRVIMLDRTNTGPSNISLPNNQCRENPRDEYLKIDCTAHSVEYNPITNTIRPLNIFSDTWCSSGSVSSDGRLVQTGGWRDGERVVRCFNPNCGTSNCDWEEIPNGLIRERWYASDHVLPDGSTIILGGRRQFNFEFFPKTPSTSTLLPFPFLSETNDPGVENNLYPFLFLMPDGNLYVYANNQAISFNYKTNTVIKNYPTIPGGDPRNYPSTGSAVLLPLKILELGDKIEAEVLICGGALSGAFERARRGEFLTALITCARMKITDQNPIWIMENMPTPRIMGDMIVLPNGEVLLINGARSGIASWELGRDPILTPVLYHPDNTLGSRFELTNPSTIPRMYHSTAVLLRDGRVLVAGSNPHQFYNFTNVLFPTELRLEAFLPPYLDPSLSDIRPVITVTGLGTQIKYNEILKINFTIEGLVNLRGVKVTMVRPPFNTHSFSMSQRILVLTNSNSVRLSSLGRYELDVRTPGSVNIAPPGYYMLFVVHQNVPSEGVWVNIA